MRFNKINVYLRAYSNNRINPDRPKWFDYEKCFLNLLKTTNFDLCNLTVCFEGDWDSYFVKNHIAGNIKVKFIDTKKPRTTFENANWSKSVAATAEVVKEDASIGENDLVYILEDDYLHRPYWAEISLDFFNHFADNNTYICLYDHADKYLFTDPTAKDHWGMYKDLKSSIITSNACHWRSVPNCGMSMIMTKRLFDRDYDLWGIGQSDCEIGHQILKRGTSIYTPMPSISTHCIRPFVAPLVDWKGLINHV